jgi:hypothetical protein
MLTPSRTAECSKKKPRRSGRRGGSFRRPCGQVEQGPSVAYLCRLASKATAQAKEKPRRVRAGVELGTRSTRATRGWRARRRCVDRQLLALLGSGARRACPKADCSGPSFAQPVTNSATSAKNNQRAVIFTGLRASLRDGAPFDTSGGSHDATAIPQDRNRRLHVSGQIAQADLLELR